MKMFDIIHKNPMPYPSEIEICQDELSDQTDTAIYVVARQAGEGGDRRVEKGDYLLSDVEVNNIKKLAGYYGKLLLVINCGSILDLSILDEVEIGAVLYYSQGGMEGGNAFADIVSGKITPSGKLTDTWGNCYHDYPSADTFSYLSGDLSHNDYKEGIYIGYRWFEATGKTPRYPFGFGLSYTDFSYTVQTVTVNGTCVTVKAQVKNTGSTYCGKEVLQLYLAKPLGQLDHECKGLVAFGKTKCLNPGESENLTLTFDMAQQGIFDEESASFLLEKGEYGLLLGNSSESAAPIAVLSLSDNVITEQVNNVCPQENDFPVYQAKLPAVAYSSDLPHITIDATAFTTIKPTYETIMGKNGEDPQLLDSLTDDDLISLCVGGGYSLKCYNKVPGAAGMTAVNLLKNAYPISFSLMVRPASMSCSLYPSNGTVLYATRKVCRRIELGMAKAHCPAVKGKPGKGQLLYHYMTAFPCGNFCRRKLGT